MTENLLKNESSRTPREGQPFAVDVCESWMDELPTIDLHHEALERLAEGQKDQKVVLLAAPRAGFGKTSLLARWVKNEKSSKVFISLPWEDSEGLQWIATANGLLRNLNRTNHSSENLQCVAAGILTSLLSQAIKSGKVPCANPEVAVRLITKDPVTLFGAEGEIQAISQWFKRNFLQLVPVLTQESGLESKAKVEIWLKRLFDYAQNPNLDTSSRLGALFLEDQPKQLMTFLRLVTLYKPVVLIADHMDALFGRNYSGVAVASFSVSLASIPKVEVVLSMNRDLWEVTFNQQLPSALRDRLDANPIYLKGLTEEEAIELIELRLRVVGVSDEKIKSFIQTHPLKSWLSKSQEVGLSARSLFRLCAHAWFKQENPERANDEFEFSGPWETKENAVDEEALALEKLRKTLEYGDDVEEVRLRATRPSKEEVIVTEAQHAGFLIEDDEPEDEIQLEREAAVAESPILAPQPSPEPSPAKVENPPPFKEATSSEVNPGASLNQLRDMLSRLSRRDKGNEGKEPPPKNLLASTREKMADRSIQAIYQEKLKTVKHENFAPSDVLGRILQLAIANQDAISYHEIESPSMADFKLPSWRYENTEIYFGLESERQKEYWKAVATYLLGRSAEIRLNQQRDGLGNVRLRLVKFLTPNDADSGAAGLEQLVGFQNMPNHSLYHYESIGIDGETWEKMQALYELYQDIQTNTHSIKPKDWVELVNEELKSFRNLVLAGGTSQF